MFLARVDFGGRGKCHSERRSLADSAEDYLSALLKNGQICGEYLFAWSNGQLIAYAHAARPDAWAERYHSEWATSYLRTAAEAFGVMPAWQILEDYIPDDFPSWHASSSLYLFTHAFDVTSPVCSGDSGLPLPTYLLPVSDRVREDLYFWANSYRHHDSIWLASGALELPAYEQLADPTSQLSATGRELCGEIEKATAKPTYFYLQRYWGRQIGEEKRLCPLCGCQWHVADRAAESPFYAFAFRCERCRLVSHCGDSEGDEHASIGEYRG